MNQVPAAPGALRIVLFGPPSAGKSSLLGAVAQSARTQEHLLGGRLQDRSEGLAELQRRVYEDRPQQTVEEVVPYAATFTPSRNGELRDVVLIDCDGRIANEILARRHLEKESGSLAREVLNADALLLAVDASTGPAELDHHFAEFVKFLRHLESNRGNKSETGGLPAFLVLTKCDLLARPDDTVADWAQRIDERKHQVRDRFERFLAQEREGPVPFGRIDLQPWATAVKQPALANSPAKPKEPFGVAELFGEALERAKAYRQRRRTTGRRLLATLAGTVAVAGAMIGLAAVFLTSKRTHETNSQVRAVENYRADEGETPSQRLREPLQRNISILTEIRNHPDFERLPTESQQYVRQRLDELSKYRDFKEQLRQVRQINQARTAADLDEIDLRLRQLVPPKEWNQTDVALLRQERLDDIKTIREEADKIENWYRDLKKQADALWASDRSGEGALSWSEWQQEVDNLLAVADRPFFRPADRLPNSARVDYATLMRLRQVDEASTDWLRSRRRLEDLRDLTAALGLAGNIPGRPSLLAIPADFTLDQARTRLADLDRSYRRWREWPSQPLPDAALAEVHRAAETSYRNLMPAGQKVVLNQLNQLTPDGRDTPELWRDLRSWLGSAADFRDWRELAGYLARLSDAKADDPVNALASFLRQDRFELEIVSLVLTLPDDLKARPAGPLVLHHHAGAEVRPVVNYVLQGDGIQDPRRRVTRYTLVRQGANVPIVYRPGDIFWAEMPLTKDAEGRDRKLMWTTSRSLVFMFERLGRPPRLYVGKDSEGTFADGVSLSVRPESGVPKVPDLVPATSLRKP